MYSDKFVDIINRDISYMQSIKLIILNACDSFEIANSLSKIKGHPHIISCDQKVGDLAAIEFTRLFYDSLFGTEVLSIC